ncbi:sugar phosphate isomerase/epimerase family protein [Ningiella sp. W23]|uniref:sugar phosphate isomerase/epimerase family protein n=1 Tax=Ningiella sp. W23 TaxID=3023715 RepID=UPI003757FD4D
MQILFFMPLWGHEEVPFASFANNTKRAGFDGIEMHLPTSDFTRSQRAEYAKIARDYGLDIILQHCETNEAEFSAHIDALSQRIEDFVPVRPRFINSHTGRDFFSEAENLAIIDKLEALSVEHALPIYHETHRSRFNFAAHLTANFVKARPNIKQTADFSHFCCVAETLLEDQAHNIATIIPSIHHIHARVGFAQSPQVSHPHAPEHVQALEAHIKWWLRILEMAHARGDEYFTITPEFGPVPYMPSLPFTNAPVVSQWDTNLYMRERILMALPASLKPKKDQHHSGYGKK